MTFKEFRDNKAVRIFGAVLGTIVLGAFGSGLWEVALKPMIASSSSFFLNTLTFGINSLKDNTYVDIARGSHDRLGFEIYILLLTFAVFTAVVGFQTLRHKIKSILRTSRQIVNPPSPEELENRADKARAQLERMAFSPQLSILLYIMVFLLVLLLSIFTSSFVRALYANSAVTYYVQLDALAAPYMSLEERQKLGSQFSQIKTKSDYVAIIEKLQNTARQNGQNCPVFYIW